jgi:hypothetical protein
MGIICKKGGEAGLQGGGAGGGGRGHELPRTARALRRQRGPWHLHYLPKKTATWH